MKYLSFFLILVSCMISCEVNNLQTNSTSQIFPDKIGDSWTYQLVTSDDSSQVINVSIVGESKLPDGTDAKLWKYVYPHYTDTLWVTSSDTVVKVYNKPCFPCSHEMAGPKLRYILPLKVGNSWHTKAPYGDTTKVLGRQNISVPAGTFSAFKISKTLGYVTNSFTKDTLWFKNNVGLIKKSQYEYNLGPVAGDGVWELQSYNVH